MATICALCDTGFPVRRNEHVAIPLVEIDGQPTDKALLLSPIAYKQLKQLTESPQDEQQSDSGTVLPTR
jgi:hypothetical protein